MKVIHRQPGPLFEAIHVREEINQQLDDMASRSKKEPRKRDLHFLNEDGMVACNPRDREAAHRAEVEGIATLNPHAVTCKKCWVVIRRTGKLRPARNARNRHGGRDENQN